MWQSRMSSRQRISHECRIVHESRMVHESIGITMAGIGFGTYACFFVSFVIVYIIQIIHMEQTVGKEIV